MVLVRTIITIPQSTFVDRRDGRRVGDGGGSAGSSAGSISSFYNDNVVTVGGCIGIDGIYLCGVNKIECIINSP